jgi:hypothetical protein
MRRTFSTSKRNPFSGHTNSYVSFSSGLNGLDVRPRVEQYLRSHNAPPHSTITADGDAKRASPPLQTCRLTTSITR